MNRLRQLVVDGRDHDHHVGERHQAPNGQAVQRPPQVQRELAILVRPDEDLSVVQGLPDPVAVSRTREVMRFAAVSKEPVPGHAPWPFGLNELGFSQGRADPQSSGGAGGQVRAGGYD
jgi:hypothetical protein